MAKDNAKANANLALWNEVCRTDPSQTRDTRAGGYQHTDINSTYFWEKATAAFGPCGQGWGATLGEPEITEVPGTKTTLVRVRVEAWWDSGTPDAPVVHHLVPVDGCKPLAYPTSAGKMHVDDEAHKKAATDGLKKALSMLGICADVYLGKFDDPAYVEALDEEFETGGARKGKKGGDTAKPGDDNAAGEGKPSGGGGGGPPCPKCKAPMQKRTRRSDGAKFWSCSTYPKCKGTIDIDGDSPPNGGGSGGGVSDDDNPPW